ncbi:MAG: TAXI family TRAP transporter solute-binding subunit [Beijerinckiaceae bacterium]|nr:TAXI family TRAP transporter solute-binding subunit [Beijerinckiaceae bacterium]
MTEPLPRGANFRRAKFLWELGLSVAGNPATPYGGDRDMCITVGNGSGEHFRPALRMATGSPILALDVAGGSLEMAMVNPSGFLTQAYRGVGLFDKPLPLRTIAIYPSWDRFVFMVHPKTGLKSLRDVKERKYPLHVSVKEDITHSTRVFIDQALSYYDFSLADIVAWGGTLNLTGSPKDARRMNALESGELDAIFDEGLDVWMQEALNHGLQLLDLEDGHFDHLAKLGWRKVMVEKDRFKGVTRDHACIDYGGWPLYAHADLPERIAYEVAAGVAARAEQIVWEYAYTGVEQVFSDTEGTPMDVPLHPGAERFYREYLAKNGR